MSRFLTPALGLALTVMASPAIANAAPAPIEPAFAATTRVAAAAPPGHLLMLDAATAPALSTIQSWQGSSPYQAVAVYIPVSASYDSRYDKVQPALNAAWVSAVRAGGWQVLPIYVGLQAPCSAYAKRLSASAASAQGAAMANDAANSAFALGLPASTPLVYDLEAYPTTDASCRAAVQTMQHSWTRRLHQLGRTSGIYGSVGSTITDIVAASQGESYAKPDVVWVAKWDGKADTNLAALPLGSWTGRRAHQFLGPATEQYPALTGPSLSVDQNVIQSSAFALPKPDITAPTLAVASTRSTAKTKAALTWTMRDPAGIARYEVQIKTGKHWTAPKKLKRTLTTSQRVAIAAGANACARVRGTDRAGNTSGWLTTCVYRWGYGKAFHGKTWKRSGNTAVSKRPSMAKGPKVSGRTVTVQTRGKVGGRVLIGGHVIGTFTRAGTHRFVLPQALSGRLAVRPTKRGKLVIVRYLATP